MGGSHNAYSLCGNQCRRCGAAHRHVHFAFESLPAKKMPNLVPEAGEFSTWSVWCQFKGRENKSRMFLFTTTT